MNRIDLDKLRDIAEAAKAVSQGWYLDHKDTYVAAQKVPEEHDWYWITGSMDTPTIYDEDEAVEFGQSDEGMRGPKKVIQAHCRHIQAFNPEVALQLLNELEEMRRQYG